MLMIILLSAAIQSGDLHYAQDMVTRYLHISYQVPANAPDLLNVKCSWSEPGKNDWKSAAVMPLLTETGYAMTSNGTKTVWMNKGELLERNAAGLKRTVIFKPYPAAEIKGMVDVDFRIALTDAQAREIIVYNGRIKADNSDVIYLKDWKALLQQEKIADKDEPDKWFVAGSRLKCAKSENARAQLTYPLDLKGHYAIFTSLGGALIRLSGDERADSSGSATGFTGEGLWNWRKMNNQHIVFKQGHSSEGYYTEAYVDYVKLVPLAPDTIKQLDNAYTVEKGLLGAYFEPYSWAFYDDVQDNMKHREPVSGYAEAGVTHFVFQLGRFGSKDVYETRVTGQLVGSTYGDPVGPNKVPHTIGVGKMQQYSHTLASELKYAKEFGMTGVPNFGASSCYAGSPLEGDISIKHPEWRKGGCLLLKIPEVRQFMLDAYREALDAGATVLSIDYCRYPDGIESRDDVVTFHRELRKLADEYTGKNGGRVSIHMRFPIRGVRQWTMFDFVTLAKEGLVDYLSPGNLQGKHHHVDVAPYVKAIKGTKCKLMPCLDALSWGLVQPGMMMWRARQAYQQGADGIYVYQADSLGKNASMRRWFRFLNSKKTVDQWWALDAKIRATGSKGIYITSPHQYWEGFNYYERIRVWLEGIDFGEVEMYVDGKLVKKCSAPPYFIGTEETDSDRYLDPGEHELLVKAKDGQKWLEQKFNIKVK
ncbi:MAG: hypothetical protein NT011_01955 [Kiritimatiellaeota bacterium]|nr:hypothetical protein [Kiritimatiellota bacterium]